jgi:prophage DNA circulation protein
MAEMTDIEGLPVRVERIEQKLDALSNSVDALSNSVDALSNSVDKRFAEVSEHFVEKRQYTEFAFDRLRGEMLAGFTRLERLVAANTSGLARLERKFDQFVDDEGRRPRRRRSGRFPKKR